MINIKKGIITSVTNEYRFANFNINLPNIELLRLQMEERNYSYP